MILITNNYKCHCYKECREKLNIWEWRCLRSGYEILSFYFRKGVCWYSGIKSLCW